MHGRLQESARETMIDFLSRFGRSHSLKLGLAFLQSKLRRIVEKNGSPLIKADFFANGMEIWITSLIGRMTAYFFKPGITWGTISSGPLAVRYSFAGCISEHCGSMCFSESNEIPYYLLALLNSSVSGIFHQFLSPTLSYRESSIGSTPCVFDDHEDATVFLSLECVTLSKSDYDSFETSWDFKRHPLV